MYQMLEKQSGFMSKYYDVTHLKVNHAFTIQQSLYQNIKDANDL